MNDNDLISYGRKLIADLNIHNYSTVTDNTITIIIHFDILLANDLIDPFQYVILINELHEKLYGGK